MDSLFNLEILFYWLTGATNWAGIVYLPLSSSMVLVGFLLIDLQFCTWCFVDRCLSFCFWPLQCLSFFDLRLLVTHLSIFKLFLLMQWWVFTAAHYVINISSVSFWKQATFCNWWCCLFCTKPTRCESDLPGIKFTNYHNVDEDINNNTNRWDLGWMMYLEVESLTLLYCK